MKRGKEGPGHGMTQEGGNILTPLPCFALPPPEPHPTNT